MRADACKGGGGRGDDKLGGSFWDRRALARDSKA